MRVSFVGPNGGHGQLKCVMAGPLLIIYGDFYTFHEKGFCVNF